MKMVTPTYRLTLLQISKSQKSYFSQIFR